MSFKRGVELGCGFCFSVALLYVVFAVAVWTWLEARSRPTIVDEKGYEGIVVPAEAK